MANDTKKERRANLKARPSLLPPLYWVEAAHIVCAKKTSH